MNELGNHAKLKALLVGIFAVTVWVRSATAAEPTATEPTATEVPTAGDDAGAPPPPAPTMLSAEDGAPIGRAAPPSEAASRPSPAVSQLGAGFVRAGLEVFAQYSYRNFLGPGNNRTWFHAFDVPRVHAAVEGQWERARGRVVLEATRSASEGSLIGVAGDSLVLRVREAFAAYRPVDALDVSAGVIPTLTAPNLDGTWMLRPLAPSALEQNGLLSPADVGAKVRFDEPHGYGFVATSAYNGDGYTSRELNRGKSVETAAEIHPAAAIVALKPLGIFASYVNGSTGTSLARANRLTGGLVWQGERVRVGAFSTYGWGFAQLGTQRVLLVSIFTRVEPIPRVLLGARFDHVVRDVGADPANTLSSIWGTGGYRIATPIEVFLALSRTLPTTRAQAELPGSDAWELRTIARVVF